MLLAISPSDEALKALRHNLFLCRYFALYARLDGLWDAASLLEPSVLLVLHASYDEEMKRTLALFKSRYPKAAILWVGRKPLPKKATAIDASLCYPQRISYKTLLSKAFAFEGKRADGSLLYRGLYLNPTAKTAAVYGHGVSFSPTDVSVLHLLAEAAPRHLSAEEIARLCSFSTEQLTASSIISRISRINACVKKSYALSRRLVERDETGYFIAR